MNGSTKHPAASIQPNNLCATALIQAEKTGTSKVKENVLAQITQAGDK